VNGLPDQMMFAWSGPSLEFNGAVPLAAPELADAVRKKPRRPGRGKSSL